MSNLPCDPNLTYFMDGSVGVPGDLTVTPQHALVMTGANVHPEMQPPFDLMGSGDFQGFPFYQDIYALGTQPDGTCTGTQAPTDQWTKNHPMQPNPEALTAPGNSGVGAADQAHFTYGPGAEGCSETPSFCRSFATNCEGPATAANTQAADIGINPRETVRGGLPALPSAPLWHGWTQFDTTRGEGATQKDDLAIDGHPGTAAVPGPLVSPGNQNRAAPQAGYNVQNAAVYRSAPSLLSPTPVAFDGGLRLRFHVVL
ncbi:hypothetical protein AURDEDRAFT_171059 [Auricularia subglabra TFB-10046 SS5]|nr:hypothetical protein AURDEDRAFT_171059 [Auricularia subglabra TFB-10046 SS5]